MYSAVYQCLRSTTVRNSELFSSRRLKSLQKAFRLVPLAKCSYHSIEYRTSYYEQKRSYVILNRHKFLCPTVCNSFYRNVSDNSPKECKGEGKPEPKLTIYQRLKKMYKEYWYVLLPVHMVTSSIWFVSFYYMAKSGVDIPALLEKLGAPGYWIEKLENSEAGNLVLAYTLFKVVTPIRYTVTIGGTTLSINYLKKLGWVKPVPNRAQIKQMYEEQKGVLKEFKTTCQDKMQVTKTELFKTKNEVRRQFNEAKEEFHKTMSEARTDFKTTVRGNSEEIKSLAKGIKESLQKK